MVLSGIFAGVVDLYAAGLCVAEERFPVSVDGVGVGGGGAEVCPRFAAVGGDADGDAEVGVSSCIGVFGVVSVGAEDFSGGELEDVGVVDVVGVGGPGSYGA